MGVHPFRDPALTEEFDAPELAIDVAEFHLYAANWRPGRVDFLVDGEQVKTVHQAPDYPMQMMVAYSTSRPRPLRRRSRITCRNWPWIRPGSSGRHSASEALQPPPSLPPPPPPPSPIAC